MSKELKRHSVRGVKYNGEEICGGFAYYDADEVDAAIAELKDKCQMHDFFWEGCGFEKRGFKNAIAVAQYVEDLEAKLRATRRALWLARAERAKTIAKIYSKEAELILLREHYPSGCGFCHIMNNKWRKVERKCRAKAEEYK